MKVVDLHCDTLNEFRHAEKRGESISFAHNDLHIDLDKLQRGDYLLQCFAMFVELAEEQDPLIAALELADIFRRLMAAYPDNIRQVKTMQDIADNRAAGRISALLTIEEGGVCKGNLAALRQMCDIGVRMMTLTWNYENELAYPNVFPAGSELPTDADTSHGLKEQGFAFLAEMERLGIIVDVSHLSDAGFWDVYRATKRPFIASHSNARSVCGHVRNLTDGMLHALAERGGITGLNYCGAFLQGGTGRNPSRIADMVRHADYIIRKAGIESLALGSDFDGIGGQLELYDCSCLPLLEQGLRKHGYHESDIEKIFYGNALRLLGEFLPAE